MSVKLRAPDGMSAINHGGIEYVVDDTGALIVPHEGIAAELAPHGLRPWNDGGDSVKVEAMTRSQLLAEVVKRTLLTVEKMPTEDIRERLLTTNPEDVKLPVEHEASGVKVDPASVTAESIDALNRPELFAFLKAKGVAVAPPITNDQLRAYAREALAK